MRLEASKSTGFREGSSKKIVEKELANLKVEFAEKKGDYEMRIVKLQGEKIIAEKQRSEY